MIGNYDKILEKISKASGLGKEEIEERVKAKIEKLSGLISKEGAAQIVAAELGISFDNEKLKIDELLPGMRRVNVLGKIIQLFPVRTFIRNGKEGKVANFIIADETSNIKVVLWDINHIELIEKNQIGEESVIEISNANIRGNEIHLGSFSEIKSSSEPLDQVRTQRTFRENNIVDFKVSDNVRVRAFVVQVFEPRFFEVCPDCKRKVILQGEGFFCDGHGKVIPEKRALMNMVIDDGTETIRAVLFNEPITSLKVNFTEFTGPDFSKQKEELLGKEMLFSGNVRINRFFNNLELIVDDVKEVNPDELIEKLEKK